MNRVPALLLASVLSGCASLDKDQCLHADWYAIGVEDGAKGSALERLGAHRRACAEYGVAPNAEAYVAGRREGLMAFCTYDRGFAEGREGRAYGSVCPDEVAADFRDGYARGRELYDLNRRLDGLNEEIRRTKAALKDGIPDPRARSREVERLENLTREAQQLEQELAKKPL
jgi:hypothetical protein